MTDLPLLSLGNDVYVQELESNGLTLLVNDEDEGQNYYYFARRADVGHSFSTSCAGG
jgi:hypothetical protein